MIGRLKARGWSKLRPRGFGFDLVSMIERRLIGLLFTMMFKRFLEANKVIRLMEFRQLDGLGLHRGWIF